MKPFRVLIERQHDPYGPYTREVVEVLDVIEIEEDEQGLRQLAVCWCFNGGSVWYRSITTDMNVRQPIKAAELVAEHQSSKIVSILLEDSTVSD